MSYIIYISIIYVYIYNIIYILYSNIEYLYMYSTGIIKHLNRTKHFCAH